MSLELRIRPAARRDLISIVRFIAQDRRSPEEAQRLGFRLLDRCEALLDAPGQGTPYLGDIRKINEGAYKIFYRVTTRHVRIVRIWDGRRGTNPFLS